MDRSFVELAEDLGEIADLAADLSQRLRIHGRVLLAERGHLHGYSLDLIEAQLRTLVAGCDAVRRDARELRRATRYRRPTREYLAGLTFGRSGLADRLRTLAGIAGATVVAAEWQSPSFEHSTRPSAGTWTGRVRPHVDDYRRDRHPDAAAFEAAYLQQYVDAAPGKHLRAVMTSCGMSAFATILGFLREEKKLDGTVVLGASTYHECRDLVRSLVPGDRLVEVSEEPPAALPHAIERHRPSVVFLDSVGNAPGVLVPDVGGVVRALAGAAPRAYLVLDNTGLSCTFQPFGLARDGGPHIIAFDSLTKYPQFGLDRVTGGLIVAERDDGEALDRRREHLGTNVSDGSVHAIPWPNRERLERRLRRLERNAVVLARALRDAADRTGRRVVAGADHPALPDHPSHAVARHLPFRGGWLSVTFATGHDDPAVHCRFAQVALEEARRSRVPLVAGASFGLDVTRIYPTAVTATSGRPFVRLSPGIEHVCEIERLAAALGRTVTRLPDDVHR